MDQASIHCEVAIVEQHRTGNPVAKQVQCQLVFRIGGALVVVTQPRMPCFKLGIRLGKPDAVKRFHASGRCGFYLGVLQEGEVGSGDLWEQVARGDEQMTVLESYRLMTQ